MLVVSDKKLDPNQFVESIKKLILLYELFIARLNF